MLEALRRAGVGRGELVALTAAPGVGVAMAAAAGETSLACGVADPSAVVAVVEAALRPRWVVWSNDTAATLVGRGVRIATCWDVAAVQRLLFGGWRAEPARVWAQLHHLGLHTIPGTAPPELFGHPGPGGDADDPVGPDGHLRVEWVNRGWAASRAYKQFCVRRILSYSVRWCDISIC